MTAPMTFLDSELPRHPPSHSRRCIGSRNATRQKLPTSTKLTYQSVYVHRCIGSRNSTRQMLSTSPKLMYLSVYDNRDGVSGIGGFPSSPSSLTDVHRYIGSRNTTRQTLSTSPKLTYLSVYDTNVVSPHST